MKQLLILLSLGLITLTQVHASVFICTQDDNKETKLFINHNQIAKPSRNTILEANVILTTNSHTQTFEGEYNETWNHYELKDSEGNAIDLKMTKMIEHGGRCGRCLPTITVNYYAKLTMNQVEMDFTCFQK
jgi:hypothetical protein